MQGGMEEVVTSFAALIRRIGKQAYIAKVLNIEHGAVRAWSSRDRIPKEHWDAVLKLATIHRINVTKADMATWREASKCDKPPPAVQNVTKEPAYTAADFE